MFRNLNRKGFTLVELLIIIAVVGVLSAGVITSINIVSKINSANIAKSETFDASIQNNLSINLVGEWTFSGNTNDTSGYGNNGTPNGGAAPAPDRKGQDSKAYNFDGGASTNISIADSNSLDLTTAVTVSVWVNIPAAATGGIVSKGGAFGNSPKGPFTLGTITTIMYWEVGDGTTNTSISSANYPTGTWTHWVGVYNGSTLSLYKNGVLVTGPTSTGVTSMLVGTSALLLADSLGTVGNLNTSMDDVRIYNQALTSYSVQQLYAQGLEKHQLAKN